MKWGLLRGNSLLRSTKNTMRQLTSQLYNTAFAQRTSRNAIYGSMQFHGITRDETLTVTAGGYTASFTVTPSDTLATIATKINSTTINGLPNPLWHDDDGPSGSAPAYQLARASVENNKLVIQEWNGAGPVTL